MTSIMPASVPSQENPGPHGAEIDEAKERKRLQNRIAQRKFRERKAQQQLLANVAAANKLSTQTKPLQNLDAKNIAPEPFQWVGKSCLFTNLPIALPDNARPSSKKQSAVGGDAKRDTEKSVDSFQCNKCGKRLFSILDDSCVCTLSTTQLATTTSSSYQAHSPLGSHSGLTPPHDISLILKASGRDDEFPFDSNGYHMSVTMEGSHDLLSAPQFMSENTPAIVMPLQSTNKADELHDFVMPTQPQPYRSARSSVSHYAENNSGNSMSDMVNETVSSAQEMNQPLLHVAASNGHCKIVQMLIEHSFDINEQDLQGMTALHVAVRCRNEDVVRLLLQHGANPYVQDQDGQSPLHLAVQTGFENAVGMFLASGVIRSSPS